jgi:hypothetical protein
MGVHYASSMKKSKYTRELLEPVIRDSVSWAEVLRRLGISFTGGNNSYVRKKVRELEIDTSHFLGLRANSGARHRGGPDKLGWREVLVLDRNGGRKEQYPRLRRAVTEYGLEEKCVWCGLTDEWNEKPLVLQLDHISGDSLDNRPENLRFLCPNCHSQTKTWGKMKNLRH